MNFKKDLANALLPHRKTWGRTSYYALTGAGMGVGIVFALLVFSLSSNPSEEYNLITFMGFLSIANKTPFLNNIKQKVVCYYCSWILFVRSFFLKEKPGFIYFISCVPGLFVFVYPGNNQEFLFMHFRILMFLGVYLCTVDFLGGIISKYIISLEKNHYLSVFFQKRFSNTLQGYYLSAGWSALLIGKTAMTATGRATIAAGMFTGGIYLYNSAAQRHFEATQADKQRTHENAAAEKQRAFENFKYARDQHERAYFRKGKKPVWSEENFKDWLK